MQQLRNYFLFALVLAAVAYVGAKVYIYYSVKDHVELGVNMARPYGRVTYEGIGSNLLGGSISLKGLTIRGYEQVLPLRVDELRLSGEGVGFLMDLAGGFDGGRFPEAMQIELRRIQVPDLSDLLPEEFRQTDASKDPLAEPPDPCSLGGLVQRIGLYDSETYPLVMHLNGGYELDLRSKRMSFRLSYRIEGRESLDMRAGLSGMPPPGAVVAGAMPVIETVDVTYRPGSDYVGGMVGECAGKAGLTPALYVGGLLAKPEEGMANQLGVVLGPGLRRALERFLLKPEQIQLEMGPIEDLSALMKPDLSPHQIIQLTNLRLNVNQEPVTDLSYREATKVQYRSSAGAGSATGAGTADTQIAARPAMRYLETPVSELNRYVGREIRLFVEKHERPHLGVLVEFEDGEASVEKRVFEGKITVHVPVKSVRRAEVRRYPETGP